ALEQPAAAAVAGDVVVFRWKGGDPWPRNPVVRIQQQVDGAWTDLTLPTNGRVVDSSWYRIVLHMEMDPPWKENKTVEAKDWLWAADFATSRNVPCPGGTLEGTFRFAVLGTWVDPATVDLTDYELLSEPFTVSLP
ncbi:MAG: hypothetical protein FJ098_11980, partial [Deltaproteobacteria bacterium]|nr:hypothetical protein [Deltaproteobacteria bacterium]